MSSLRQSNGNPVTTEHQSDLDVSFSRRAKKKPSSSHVINQLSTTERNDDESKNRENIKDMGAIYFEVKGKLKTHHIDRYCRVFFPASFVFLNSCYLIFHFIKYDRSDRDINWFRKLGTIQWIWSQAFKLERYPYLVFKYVWHNQPKLYGEIWMWQRHYPVPAESIKSSQRWV